MSLILSALSSFVPMAVMPKGVEHKDLLEYALEKELVPMAVMPKGVEHVQTGPPWR